MVGATKPLVCAFTQRRIDQDITGSPTRGSNLARNAIVAIHPRHGRKLEDCKQEFEIVEADGDSRP